MPTNSVSKILDDPVARAHGGNAAGKYYCLRSPEPACAVAGKHIDGISAQRRNRQVALAIAGEIAQSNKIRIDRHGKGARISLEW